MSLQLSGPDGAFSWGTHFNLINQMSSYSSRLFVVKETLTTSCQMLCFFTGRWFRQENPPVITKYFRGCFQVLNICCSTYLFLSWTHFISWSWAVMTTNYQEMCQSGLRNIWIRIWWCWYVVWSLSKKIFQIVAPPTGSGGKYNTVNL